MQFALWISLVLPLAWIAMRFFGLDIGSGVGSGFGGSPSANPAQELNHLFGQVAISAVVLNLWIGHLLAFHRSLTTRFPWSSSVLLTLKKFRRSLGVAGWLYLIIHIAFHFLIEAGLAEGFEAILHARYLWVGSLAALVLTALALTSNNASQRKLGRKWAKLHRLVYVAFFLAIAHTLMIEKANIPYFATLGIATALPFAVRLGFWALKQRKKTDARQQLPPN